MKDLCFNETSLSHPLTEKEDKVSEYSRLNAYFRTFKEAQKENFNRIRYKKSFDEIFLSRSRSLTDCCNDPTYRTFSALLLGTARYPFIDDNSKEETRFIENDFYMTKDNETFCVCGLAAAYLYNTIGIHFKSLDTFWEQPAYPLQIKGEEEGIYQVISVSDSSHFQSKEYQLWKEKTQETELIECSVVPGKKDVHLRDDHGKDLLIRLANKLCLSPYVVKIVNSLPYNPGENQFIRNIFPDGKIEIVLTKTDKGLGLIVQTTGRNYRETYEIAQLLKNKYTD